MKSKTLHLYLSLPINLDRDVELQVFQAVNTRHPAVQYETILEGYWGDVQESTLLIEVTCSESYLRDTVDIIKGIYPNSFVAIDDPNE